jgi:hypothetical protein
MAEISGALYRNLTASESVKLGAGKVYGVVVNSHTNGTMKLLDGVDNTAGAKATSTLTTSGIVPAVHAVNVFTLTDVMQDTETVTIGDVVYKFVTALTDPAQPYEVLIGASAAASLDNLKSAINGTAGAGTTYGEGTEAHPTVIATTNSDTAQTIHSRRYGTVNNTLATTETTDNGSWADTTLGGGTGASNPGVDTTTATFVIDGESYYFTTELSETIGETAVANEILWVTNDATALDNMKLAINGSGTEGTNYSTGTNAHPTVIATTNGDTTQVIEAKVFGSLGNSITTTETMTTTAWTGTTLSGGTDAARTMLNTYSFASGSQSVIFAEPITFVNGLFFTVGGTLDATVLYN